MEAALATTAADKSCMCVPAVKNVPVVQRDRPSLLAFAASLLNEPVPDNVEALLAEKMAAAATLLTDHHKDE